MHASVIAVLALAVSLAACASSPEAGAAASTNTSAAETATPDLAGTYAFVFEESDVFAGMKTKCAGESGGDAAKASACVAAVAAEAAKEGLRFDKDAQGRVTWVSYGNDDGKAVVYHQVPIALTSDSPTAATARTLGPATGALAQKRPIPTGTVMRFELVDARTIAMADPSKGRLVFRRAAK